MRALAAALLVVLACAPAASAPSLAPSASPTSRAVVTAPPSVFDDMMGAAPAATVFVVTPREVLAVTLLNHYVRYRIPVGPDAQLATSVDGSRLYVAEDDGTVLRLRWFDVLSGTERATLFDHGGDLVRTGIGRGALAHDAQRGRLLVLKRGGDGARIDAYDDFTLRRLGGGSKKAGCADRVLASASRFAIACLSMGEFVVGTDEKVQYVHAQPTVGLAGAGMASDGTIYLVTRDGELQRIPAGEARWERVAGEPLGRVAPDGVALTENGRLVVAAAEEAPSPRVTILPARGGVVPVSLRLPARSGGVLAQGRFAYFLTARGVQHIDLESGLVEVMAGPFDRDAVPGAVAAR